jgi:hypothetical protein
MRLVLAMVLAGLAALPLTASAQAGEEGTTSEPDVQEPAPSTEPAPEEPSPPTEPAPEEPALQLKLDDAGVEVAPSPPRTPDGFTLEEMELRVRRAKIGFNVSLGVLGAGSAIFLVASFVAIAQWGEDKSFDRAETAMLTGGVLLTAGLVGFVTSAILLSRRKRDRDTLRTAHYGTPRRVQWDLARSRLVF